MIFWQHDILEYTFIQCIYNLYVFIHATRPRYGCESFCSKKNVNWDIKLSLTVRIVIWWVRQRYQKWEIKIEVPTGKTDDLLRKSTHPRACQHQYVQTWRFICKNWRSIEKKGEWGGYYNESAAKPSKHLRIELFVPSVSEPGWGTAQKFFVPGQVLGSPNNCASQLPQHRQESKDQMTMGNDRQELNYEPQNQPSNQPTIQVDFFGFLVVYVKPTNQERKV